MTQSNEIDIISFQKSLQPMRAKQRLDAILARPDAMKVVRQMPVQDLFITIKEVGLSDSLELLELLSTEQVKSCLDLDGWNHDRIDPKALGDWLESLFAANPRRAVQNFRELDIELVSLLLKTYTSVYDLIAEEEPVELNSPYSTTPDHRYMIVFHEEAKDQHLVRFLKDALEQLYGRDMPFALRMVEAIRWETESMLEEEALRWRDGRMQDLGFAPMDEVKEILAYVDPDQALKGVLKTDIHEEAGLNLSASILLVDVNRHQLLGKALASAPAQVAEHFLSDLISTSNRVHMAMALDAGDPDALKQTVLNTTHKIEMALAFLSQQDDSKLQTLLTQFRAPRLFQIGRSLALKLGREFRKLIQSPHSGLAGDGLLFLDSPLAEVVAGVLRAEPVCFRGLRDEKRLDYQPFENLQDVLDVTIALKESAFRAFLLGPKGLNAPQIAGPKTLTHGVLFATWLCHAWLGENPSFTPLTQADLTRLLELFKQGDKDVPLQTIRDLELQPSAEDRALKYAGIVLGAAASELLAVKDLAIDARFVATLIVDRN